MSSENPKGSFVRWQSITIAQLTYCVNLILGLSVAALGFQITLLLNDKFSPTGWQGYAFSFAIIILLASIGLGIWCIINRLGDFRATMNAARHREKVAPESEIQTHRDLYNKKRSWGQALPFEAKGKA